MGMWQKDKLYGGERLANHVTIGTSPADSESVALYDIAIISDEVPTNIGNATKTAMVIAKHDGKKWGEPMTVNTLASAIADKARVVEDGDLPAVVCFFVTPSGTDGYNDATVMQFVRPYTDKVPDFLPLTEAIPF